MNNDNKDPLLLDHDYDGIQELDNKLPRWWVWLFNLCIVFAVIYYAYYHVMGRGKLMAAQYQEEMKRATWPRSFPRKNRRCWPTENKPLPPYAHPAIARTAAVWWARIFAMITGSTAPTLWIT